MLGHHDVADNDKPIAAPDLFQNFEKQVAILFFPQQCTSLITARRDEVQISGAVITMQLPGHSESVSQNGSFRCDQQPIGARFPMPTRRNPRRVGQPIHRDPKKVKIYKDGPAAQKCYPCSRYILLPMSPGWTMKILVGARGFEPPTPWSRTRFESLLKFVEFCCS